MSQTNVPEWMTTQISFQRGAEAKANEPLRVVDVIAYIRNGDDMMQPPSGQPAPVSSVQRKMRLKIAECYGKGMDADSIKKVIDPTKKRFPATTFSGTFPDGRKADLVETHSGMICQDIDLKPKTADEIPDIEQRQAKLRELLSQDVHVAGMFTSPSGYGLKPLFLLTGMESWIPEGASYRQRVEAINLFHAAAFITVKDYLYQSYASLIFNGEVDEQWKDVSRLCFMPHDPKITWKNDPAPFDLTWSKEMEAQVSRFQGEQPRPDTRPRKKIQPKTREGNDSEEGVPDWLPSALEHLKPHCGEYDTWLRVIFALATTYNKSDDGLDVADEWSRGVDNYGSRDVVEKAYDGTDGSVTAGTIWKMAKDTGWTPPRGQGYVTPSEWFAMHHPELVEKYGQAFQHRFVQRKWTDKEGEERTTLIWTPTDLNETLFAALLIREGNDIDPAVFDQDENHWFRYDSGHGSYSLIKTEALQEPLSKLFLQVARETRHFCVDTSNLEFRFRDTRSLTPIIQKASGLCTVHSDFWRWPYFTLPVKNGVLDVGKVTLRPHSPDFHFRGVVNVDFKAEVGCPEWIIFLKRALPEDDIELLQRFFGLVLVGQNVAQKLMILSGTSQSGKGVIARVLTGLIGPENVGTLRTGELEGRFELARLRHKMLVYGGDVAADFLNTKGARTLKAITGADPVSVEFKGSNATPAAEPIYGSVLVTANSRLKVRFEADTEAWRRRIVLISFECESVSEEDQQVGLDVHLLRSEGSGILNWALEGLRNLDQDGGKLLLNERQQAVRDKLIEESESYVAFAKEGVVEDDGASLGATEAYEEYVSFCYARGWTPLTVKRFGSAFKETVATLYGITQSNDHLEGRGWHGIRVHRSRRGRTGSHRRNPLEDLRV